MSGQATVRSLTGLLHDLTDEEIAELAESGNRPGLKEFLLNCVMRRKAIFLSKFFFPLPDSQVLSIHNPTITKYRAEASQQGIPDSTPLCYRVAKSFTLKAHAPKAGPCHENFQYLQSWNFPDEPTQDCLVFWFPRLEPRSMSKNVDEQRQYLVEFRKGLALPAHHCASFGNVALVSGLILAHHKATGEKVPVDGLWTRTDSCRADGSRLMLYWRAGALDCGRWVWGDDRVDCIGVFALGVEALGS